MTLGLLQPWVALLLPAAVLPLLLRRRSRLAHPSISLLPRDRLAAAIGISLRLAAAFALVLLILGAGGLHRVAVQQERIGEGAEIVLLLDRSRSMDEPFATRTGRTLLSTRAYDSKGTIARNLLDEFVASRRNDRYAMLIFSTRPILILPLTDKPALVQAAIRAGNVGKGLAETNVGAGLIKAVETFAGQHYRGSRLIVLISDGGATIDVATRYQIENLLRRHRVALYWVYLRSRGSHGIADDVTASERIAPARALHRFFANMQSPYRAYDAEDPLALRRAIDDVNQLQSLPIHYMETIPRRDVSRLCYQIALVLLGFLIVAHLVEIRAWSSD